MKHKIFLLIVFCFFIFVIKAQFRHPSGRFIEVNGVKLWVEMDGKGAAKLPQDATYPNDFNSKLYYQLHGSDGDFTAGNDIAKFDVTAQLKTLKMPVLIVAGRYDKGHMPKFSIKYKEYCPKAQFVMFEHSGHFPQVEESEKEFALIKEFLRR